MVSFLDILLIVVLFFVQKKLMDSFTQKHQLKNTVQPPKVVHMNFEVEKINNIYYAWKDGVEFVGQSESEEKLEEIINQYIMLNVNKLNKQEV